MGGRWWLREGGGGGSSTSNAPIVSAAQNSPLPFFLPESRAHLNDSPFRPASLSCVTWWHDYQAAECCAGTGLEGPELTREVVSFFKDAFISETQPGRLRTWASVFSLPDDCVSSVMKAPIVAALRVQTDVVIRGQNASLASFYPGRRNCRPLVEFLCFYFVCMPRFFLNSCISIIYILLVLVEGKVQGSWFRNEQRVVKFVPPKRNDEGEEEQRWKAGLQTSLRF